jgi:HEAT repeats
MKICLLTILLLTCESATAGAQTSRQSRIEAAIDGWSSRASTRVAILKLTADPVPTLVMIAKSREAQEIRRQHAITLLATFDTAQSARALTEIADDANPGNRCFALQSLVELKSADSVPILVRKLDDHSVCMKTVSTDPTEEQKVYVSDEAIRLLVLVTGQSFENTQRLDGHKASDPWKEWWRRQAKSSKSDSQRR